MQRGSYHHIRTTVGRHNCVIHKDVLLTPCLTGNENALNSITHDSTASGTCLNETTKCVELDDRGNASETQDQDSSQNDDLSFESSCATFASAVQPTIGAKSSDVFDLQPWPDSESSGVSLNVSVPFAANSAFIASLSKSCAQTNIVLNKCQESSKIHSFHTSTDTFTTSLNQSLPLSASNMILSDNQVAYNETLRPDEFAFVTPTDRDANSSHIMNRLQTSTSANSKTSSADDNPSLMSVMNTNTINTMVASTPTCSFGTEMASLTCTASTYNVDQGLLCPLLADVHSDLFKPVSSISAENKTVVGKQTHNNREHYENGQTIISDKTCNVLRLLEAEEKSKIITSDHLDTNFKVHAEDASCKCDEDTLGTISSQRSTFHHFSDSPTARKKADDKEAWFTDEDVCSGSEVGSAVDEDDDDDDYEPIDIPGGSVADTLIQLEQTDGPVTSQVRSHVVQLAKSSPQASMSSLLMQSPCSVHPLLTHRLQVFSHASTPIKPPIHESYVSFPHASEPLAKTQLAHITKLATNNSSSSSLTPSTTGEKQDTRIKTSGIKSPEAIIISLPLHKINIYGSSDYRCVSDSSDSDTDSVSSHCSAPPLPKRRTNVGGKSSAVTEPSSLLHVAPPNRPLLQVGDTLPFPCIPRPPMTNRCHRPRTFGAVVRERPSGSSRPNSPGAVGGAPEVPPMLPPRIKVVTTDKTSRDNSTAEKSIVRCPSAEALAAEVPCQADMKAAVLEKHTEISSSNTTVYCQLSWELWKSASVTPSRVKGVYTESGNNTTCGVHQNRSTAAKQHTTPSSDDDSIKSTSGGSTQRSQFENEPLYQVYHRNLIARSLYRQQSSVSDSDRDSVQSAFSVRRRFNSEPGDRCSESESAETSGYCRGVLLDSMLKIDNSNKSRTLWCEMPQVISSGLLASMTTSEKRLQEVLFEVITSEASYLRSIHILISNFVESPQFDAIHSDVALLSKRDYQFLFSNVYAVWEVSSRFLAEMEKVWNDNVLLDSAKLCKTITNYATDHFDVYVRYCTNQMYQDRKLKELRQDPEFMSALCTLERQEDCHGLTLSSFFMLPVQRITRLPLLIDAVCHRMDSASDSYSDALACFNVLQKLVKQCNQRAKQMVNLEEVARIDSMLDFKNVKLVPLVSQSRSLIKQGQLTHILQHSVSLLDMLSRRKESLHLFLFNDIMVITKIKGEGQYLVVDTAPRVAIQAESIQDSEIDKWLPNGVPSGYKNLFVMVLLERNTEYVMACESLSEMTRWVEAVTPAQQLCKDEKIYEDWDCPQVQVINRYTPQQPDELLLEESDVVNIYRKMADGWYEGERIRDGERGWFPSSYTVEIQSAHRRAKNLRQKYRLLQRSHLQLQEKLENS